MGRGAAGTNAGRLRMGFTRSAVQKTPPAPGGICLTSTLFLVCFVAILSFCCHVTAGPACLVPSMGLGAATEPGCIHAGKWCTDATAPAH